MPQVMSRITSPERMYLKNVQLAARQDRFLYFSHNLESDESQLPRHEGMACDYAKSRVALGQLTEGGELARSAQVTEEKWLRETAILSGRSPGANFFYFCWMICLGWHLLQAYLF